MEIPPLHYIIEDYIIHQYGSDSREYKYHDNMAEYGMHFSEWVETCHSVSNSPRDFAQRYWAEATPERRDDILASCKYNISSQISAMERSLEELDNISL